MSDRTWRWLRRIGRICRNGNSRGTVTRDTGNVSAELDDTLAGSQIDELFLLVGDWIDEI